MTDKSRGRPWQAVASFSGTALTALILLTQPSWAQAANATPLLPDLDQETPRHVGVFSGKVDGRTRWRIAFDSSASNVGDGPMLLHGVRASGTAPTMRADQLVRMSDGRVQLTKGVGRIRYVRLHDHRHWHFLDFERYELRDNRTMQLVAHDNKSGFCLGDRYRVSRKVKIPARVNQRVYGDNCGPRRDKLMGIFEGMSPGWGDRYVARLEGQYVDLAGVHSGTYQLVNRVNPDGRLIERTLVNNAATNRIRITWPHGHDSAPSVRVIAVCPASFGCGGAWPAGQRPIPADLVGTPFGDALRAADQQAPNNRKDVKK